MRRTARHLKSELHGKLDAALALGTGALVATAFLAVGREGLETALFVWASVHAAGDAAGLNGEGRERVGVHDLRHSFVAVALAAGLTLPEAAALARHANPRVTAAVYAGLTDAARAGLADKLAIAFGRSPSDTSRPSTPSMPRSSSPTRSTR